jgi:hypothetical protein
MRRTGFPLALAIAMTMAAPALAKTWDVCVNPATDVRFSTESVNSAPLFFVGAAPIFPSGTLGDHGLAACPDISRAAGTFFAMGGQVAGLPAYPARRLSSASPCRENRRKASDSRRRNRELRGR